MIKTCTCKNCGHVFVARRTRAYCTQLCRLTATRMGANNETSNKPQEV